MDTLHGTWRVTAAAIAVRVGKLRRCNVICGWACLRRGCDYTDDMGTLAQDLIDSGYELRETHISQVFLGREDVYKVKKPVALGFLDFSTPELRARYCAQEVELNQRLAPGVYLGV